MFRYIKKLFRAFKIKKEKANEDKTKKAYSDAKISSNLNKNLKIIKNILGENPDVIIKEFALGCSKDVKAALILIDGITNRELIDLNILKPLMYDSRLDFTGIKANAQKVSEALLSSCEIKKTSGFGGVIDNVLSGDVIFLAEGFKEALSISLRKWEKRGIEEPPSENVVRGPRQGFTETLRVNTSLLRRIIKNPALRFEIIKVGRQTKTDVCIAYIKGIAKDELIQEIKRRLLNISTDSILDSGYVEAFIEDAPFSIFPTINNTGRPDTAAGKILEGRAALIVDGSPFVLTMPMVLLESFQTSEDYYTRTYFASVLRIIRLISYFIAIMASALYVALTTFHQELIPTQLLFTMTSGLSGVPFPALVEALIMVITFDILIEAGIRLPRPIGSAISIVGALVIGQSAVSAGLIGPFMVIIIAITAIASFVVPTQMNSIALSRYFLLIMAGFLGGFGIAAGFLWLLVHLISLKSFGVPYLSPVIPFNREGQKDTFVRMPLWTMVKRPFILAGRNKKRRQRIPPPGFEPVD